MRQNFVLLLVGTLAAIIAHIPGQSVACGGFFCSVNNLLPVEQNAERILFEVHTEGKRAGTVTATVEISYSGSPEDFSWVVPVPDIVGTMGVAPAETLLLLDDVTAPVIVPPFTQCSTPDVPPPLPFSFWESDVGMAMDEGAVDVIDLPQVGPYEPELVSSEDPGALIVWLNDNGYLITPEMEPFVADYVAAGLKFLAMKLASDASTSDVAPVKFTYPGEEPMVPISLTAVSAEPEMGVLVFVAADGRYEASNFDNLEIDTSRVRADPRDSRSNYYPLVSWEIDQRGGRAAVTEYANFASSLDALLNVTWSWNLDFVESLSELGGVFERQNYVTRLYMRMSGWEMTQDPVFEAGGNGLVSNIHDLSDQPAVEVCGTQASETVPCGTVYCGEGAECATTEDELDGCVCPTGTVARLIASPRVLGQPLEPTVYCQDQTFDLMDSLAGMDLVGVGTDPCAASDCGSAGRCVALNGFPTCSCDEGYAAVVDFNGLVCVEAVETYDASQLLWPQSEGCSCAVAESGSRAHGALALLGLISMLVRRRRSKLGRGC
ncbi:MAG: hypothetical protein CL558_06135 [Alphaproteobacteria bacterium]|nr:hypothetical protein [Alphaproteobacteria bacterium]HCP47425.1 hypothetical protein [Deltaproteobacteria bacterium]